MCLSFGVASNGVDTFLRLIIERACVKVAAHSVGGRMILVLSLIFATLLFFIASAKGMPAKRWAFLGGLFGPFALALFNVHYRRALMRSIAQCGIIWRP